MTIHTSARETANRGRLLIIGVLTVAVLAGVAFGVNNVWQKRFGPTTASAADCALAQQLFDKAQTPPSEKTEADKWEQDIRKVRYARLKDEGISTQVGKYVHWAAAKATGERERPTAQQFEQMKSEAIGHCRDSGVNLTISAIAS